jgi:hypothetical protein
MTRLELDIGDVVLRGLPASYGATFGGLLEERLGALARGDAQEPGRQDLGDEQALVDQVAHQVWAEVRRSAGGAWSERP